MLTTLAPSPSLTFLPSLSAYLRLELARAMRNRRFLVISLAFPLALYVFYTSAGMSKGSFSVDGMPFRTWFLVSMAAFGAIGATLSAAVAISAERSSGWTRQLRAMPLAPSAYVVAKLVAGMALALPALALVGAAGILLDNVQLGAAAWALLIVSFTLGSLPFSALALLMGYVFDTETVQPAISITYFLFAIIGGLFSSGGQLSGAVATIGHVLPSYYFADLGRGAAAGRGVNLQDAAVLAGFAVVFGAVGLHRYRAEEHRARG